ncbi:MAG: flagellar basal-body rod protein FlgG [Pseudomonadales bacterium]|nr:flagellar basal-body rod protein FlgG [Pseudomonadales bacterium]MCB1665333.1 flagellar basal-body rod protein FlgG [Pseudomonadales bacterium]MCP5331369.1 flagellar basal-body rod protein FlgG [Pseudomonadales bacterium]MCP5344378.1 flagellar basal-body rod protein FlgG [Pseudomonadales bacterium]MCP5357539.1 flagellar basal-body rod protein FlgG [Pseudomonadales bacterium]
MHPALYVSKTGLSAQDKQLTSLSNNLSNVATTGFKRDRVVFQDLLYQIYRQPGGNSTQDTLLPSGMQMGTGVRTVGTQKVFSQGALQTTEETLDVAINGRGFFQITMPDGTAAYTRDGQFQLSAEGQLVTTDGLIVAPGISIPINASTVTIGTDGTVTAVVAGETASTQVGNLTLVDFVNPSGLQAMGGNLFRETVASGSPQESTPGTNGLGSLEQGLLENSNVDVVEELVNMITTQRAYEMNSRVISTADQMLQFISQNL